MDKTNYDALNYLLHSPSSPSIPSPPVPPPSVLLFLLVFIHQN